MFVVCVTVYVVPGKARDFIEATLKNAQGARTEPGNLRFDVSQAMDDENRFFLYEVYRSEADFVAHQKTPHYIAWRDQVQDWMAEKRVGVKHRSVFPAYDAWG